MNQDWNDFLLSRQAVIGDGDVGFAAGGGGRRRLYALNHLGVLAVTGADAGAFLQGQATCDLRQADARRLTLGAFCSPQGRVVSTFWLLPAADGGDGYWLLLPSALVDAVRGGLQKYIMRAKVQVHDRGGQLCVLGCAHLGDDDDALPVAAAALPLGRRALHVATPAQAMDIWAEKSCAQGYVPTGSAHWRFLDIDQGWPWLDAASSGGFTPHMLSLDRLGAVSFDKGCYTGQEVVARTHYLGKAKRRLATVGCQPPLSPPTLAKLADGGGQAVGEVLGAASADGVCRLLCVLAEEAAGAGLNLPDFPGHTVEVLKFYG